MTSERAGASYTIPVRHIHLLLFFAVAGAAASIQDEAISKLLANRVDTAKKAVGIVVGVLDEKGIRILSHGQARKNSTETLNGDTVFEIGSITKAFTGILLAEMATRGEVGLEDPASKFLPESVKVPAQDARQITLLDLATHASGLPRLPSGFKPADPQNPYADYRVETLYEFLTNHKLARAIGERYEYSNLGAGLLGHALALKAGKTFEDLLAERVLKPLSMTSTSVALTASQRQRLAQGHDASLAPAKNWDIPVLAGAGALRSTANDMLKLLAASTAPGKDTIGKALALAQQTRRETGQPALEIGLGWHILSRFGTRLVWHNGGTGGFRSFAGFVPEKKLAVVVLANTFFDIDDIGLHALEPQYKAAMLEAPKETKEITLDPKILSSYTGVYALAPTFSITVTLEAGQLFVQATGQPRFPVFAESETKFFLKVMEAQVEFVKDASGAVTDLILYQGGRQAKGKRTP